jgi:hypothetical protein
MLALATCATCKTWEGNTEALGSLKLVLDDMSQQCRGTEIWTIQSMPVLGGQNVFMTHVIHTILYYIYINLLNTTIPLICNLVIIDSNYTINEYPITTYLLTYILYSHVINVPWVFHPVLGGQRSGCWGVLRSDLGYSGPAFSVQVKIWSFPKSCGESHPTNWW